ncbi:4055_t:CDS:1, partial [Scutellospora calospora]
MDIQDIIDDITGLGPLDVAMPPPPLNPLQDLVESVTTIFPLLTCAIRLQNR